MKKLKKGRKFKREKDQRKALLIALASALILSERIKTTEAKAKELSPFIEKKITRARKGDLLARRLLLKDFSPDIVKKLISDIAPKYKERQGGYTRVVKLGQRKSDGARTVSYTHLDVYKRQVIESLPNGFFKVELDNDEGQVLAHLAGKLRVNKIRVLLGDREMCIRDRFKRN